MKMSGEESKTTPPGKIPAKERLIGVVGTLKSGLEVLAGKILSQKMLSNIRRFFQDKDEKILLDLKELERDNPNDTRVKIKIAETLFKRNQIPEAIEKLESAASSFSAEQFHLKAIDVYKKILRIKPDYISANLRLAEFYQKLGMITEAANQLRIIINHHAQAGELAETRGLAEKVVKLDPSLENRIKLAEIYQSCSMTEQAVEQYEEIAKEYRNKKDYGRLLYFYELIMPHRPDNTAVLKDICVLHLRQKNPARSLHFMEQYRVLDNPSFKDLVEKAGLMLEALRRQKNRKTG